MPNIAPSSTISLYRGVDITDGQQIAFRSVSEQRNYFASKRVTNNVNCSYVRKTGRLKIEQPMSVVSTCNYISFTNPSFENVVFYGWITNWEYINNVTTEVTYSIDYFQTYMFELTYRPSIIEREHLSAKGYKECEANPYNMSADCYELTTAESLPMAPDMCRPLVDGDNLKVVGSQTDEEYITILISSWDYDELDPIDLRDNVDFWVDENGEWGDETNTFILLPGDVVNFKISHAFGVYCIRKGRADKFRYVIDYLTKQTLTQNVIGVYLLSKSDLSFWLVSNSPGYEVSGVVEFVPNKNYRNKKLCRFPYSYIAAESISGSRKEYHWEDFLNINGSNIPLSEGVGKDRCYFTRCVTVDSLPTSSLVPVYYKHYISGGPWKDSYNLNERLVGGSYPQVGYTTDAFLTYMSNKYTSYLGNMSLSDRFAGETNFALDKAKLYTNAATGYINSVGDIAGGAFALKNPLTAPSGVQSIANGIGGLAQTTVDTISGAKDIGYKNIEYDAMMAYREGDEAENVYGYIKPAYVADAYTPPSLDTDAVYYLGDGYTCSTYYLKSMQLLPSIAAQYDNYFSLYGYSSHRLGIPRIVNYIMGDNDESNLPSWNNDLGNGNTTYVKTSNILVDHVNQTVEAFVKNMFNAGIRFLKGSDLIG